MCENPKSYLEEPKFLDESESNPKMTSSANGGYHWQLLVQSLPESSNWPSVTDQNWKNYLNWWEHKLIDLVWIILDRLQWIS